MKNIRQFLKFGIVGILNTTITYIIYSLLIYKGVYYILANTIGYAAGVANSFIWNSRWVFKKGSSSSSTLFKFIIVNVLVLGISNYLLYIFIDALNFNKYLSQAIVISINMVINFLLNKLWTFKGND